MARRSLPLALAAVTLLALRAVPPAGALERLGPGDVPPPFRLPALAGEPVALADLAGAPAVVLFWSTWSPRSAEMLADFARYHAELGPRGLRVVAVNVDGEDLGGARREAVRAYVAARALPFPVLLDEGLRTFAAWGVMAHPTEVLLDRDGRIAYVLPGYPLSLREELRGRIAAALGLPAPAAAAAAPPPPPASGPALMHFNLGRRFLEKGDPERARASFRRAGEEDPGFLEAAVMQARVSLALEDVAEAERLARELAPEVVNRADLRYVLGMIALQKGEVAGASRIFAAVRERFPGEGWGEWGLGLAALAGGDAAAALPSLEVAAARLPANAEGEAALRRLLRPRWLRGEAVPGEERLVELFPTLADLRGRLRGLR